MAATSKGAILHLNVADMMQTDANGRTQSDWGDDIAKRGCGLSRRKVKERNGTHCPNSKMSVGNPKRQALIIIITLLSYLKQDSAGFTPHGAAQAYHTIPYQAL